MELILPPRAIPVNNTSHITRREIQILSLMAEGCVYKQIATQLNIGSETVKTHVRNIFKKIEVHNKMDALNKTRYLVASF